MILRMRSQRNIGIRWEPFEDTGKPHTDPLAPAARMQRSVARLQPPLHHSAKILEIASRHAKRAKEAENDRASRTQLHFSESAAAQEITTSRAFSPVEYKIQTRQSWRTWVQRRNQTSAIGRLRLTWVPPHGCKIGASLSICEEDAFPVTISFSTTSATISTRCRNGR